MRHDWYSATIRASERDVLGSLRERLGGQFVRTRPMHGYERGYALEGPSGPVARVLAGGANDHPHAWASGGDTESFVDVVRDLWPDEHVVTRMDAAEDFQGPGAFDTLSAQCLTLADSLRLKVSHSGDWHRGVDGRTIYIGSRKSAVFGRLYEKGKQQIGKPGQVDDISPDWVRLELQVRPEGPARAQAARSTPDEAWGYSRWSGELLEAVTGLNVPRVQMAAWRPSDDARAFDAFTRQYGQLLLRMHSDLGDWDCVGRTIGEAVLARAARRH